MLNHPAPLDRPVQLDRLFHALADPTRRAMVERLSRAPATVSELAEPVSISLAAIVQHVQILEASGLVRTEKIGRTRTCRINTDTLAAAERWLEARRNEWSGQLDRLGDYLARSSEPSPKDKEPK